MAPNSAVVTGGMVSRRTGKIDEPSRTYVKSWKRESSARLFTNTTILPTSKPKALLLLHSSSDLAPLVRTGASTRPLSVALTIRAAARALCSALCSSSLLAYFRVGWADIERVVCTLRRHCISTRPRTCGLDLLTAPSSVPSPALSISC